MTRARLGLAGRRRPGRSGPADVKGADVLAPLPTCCVYDALASAIRSSPSRRRLANASSSARTRRRSRAAARRDRSADRASSRATASASCASRAAIRSSSGAAAKKRKRCTPRASRSKIVPGITSAIAAPAYAGIPVTHRDHDASFYGLDRARRSAQGRIDARLREARRPEPHAVFLMAMGNLRGDRRASCARTDLPDTTPVAIVRDGTQPTQRRWSRRSRRSSAEVAARAVRRAGDRGDRRRRARCASACAGSTAAPLFGKRVLITRSRRTGRRVRARFAARAAPNPILAPTIAIGPPDDRRSRPMPPSPRSRRMRGSSSPRKTASTRSSTRLRARGADARALGGAKVAAIGERTADRLREYGIAADAVPRSFVAEEIARIVLERCTPGERVLVFRAQEARDVLPQRVGSGRHPRRYGRSVQNRRAARSGFRRESHTSRDVLTFTSASTVRGFAALLGGNEAAVRAASGQMRGVHRPDYRAGGGRDRARGGRRRRRRTRRQASSTRSTHASQSRHDAGRARRTSCGVRRGTRLSRARAHAARRVCSLRGRCAGLRCRRMARRGRAVCIFHSINAAFARRPRAQVRPGRRERGSAQRMASARQRRRCGALRTCERVSRRTARGSFRAEHLRRRRPTRGARRSARSRGGGPSRSSRCGRSLPGAPAASRR